MARQKKYNLKKILMIFHTFNTYDLLIDYESIDKSNINVYKSLVVKSDIK